MDPTRARTCNKPRPLGEAAALASDPPEAAEEEAASDVVVGLM